MGKQVKKHGYTCKLLRVVDGDTCDAMIDLGFDVWVKSRIRFYGVDTWESRTRDLEEKAKGLEAKAYVKDLLENEGIIAFLKDDFIGTLVPWHAAPAGYQPVKVFVSDSNQVQAMKVVEQFEANTSKSS